MNQVISWWNKQAEPAFKTVTQSWITLGSWTYLIILANTGISVVVDSPILISVLIRFIFVMALWLVAYRIGANYHHNAIYATGVFCDDWKAYPSYGKLEYLYREAGETNTMFSMWDAYNGIEDG